MANPTLPVGVLAAYYRARHRFGDEELRVLTSIAHQTALALEKVRFYTELQANLRELQETQAQLMHQDKMAGFGLLWFAVPLRRRPTPAARESLKSPR